MKELLPKLVPLKGIFGVNPSLVDCIYIPDDLAVGGPTIRFSLGIANVGKGPLHIILHDIREQSGKSIASAKQRIFNEDGTFREVDINNFERTPHDMHDAWHYPGLVSFELFDEQGNLVMPGKKTYYCMVDTFRLPDSVLNTHGTVNSPKDGVFKFDKGCLSKTGGEVGISVGWADSYSTTVADQYIDISDIQTGTYILRLEVNKTELITEIANKEELPMRINKEEGKIEKLEK